MIPPSPIVCSLNGLLLGLGLRNVLSTFACSALIIGNPGHCSTKWSWLSQRTQMGDTTGLDGSGAEDCAPLLNSNASSLRTTDVNLASLSKLGLTLCIPPLLVAVEVVSCLLSTLTGSHSRVFSATSSKNCHASSAVLLVNVPLQRDSIIVLFE